MTCHSLFVKTLENPAVSFGSSGYDEAVACCSICRTINELPKNAKQTQSPAGSRRATLKHQPQQGA
jgi:hypothetical protein